MPAIQMTLREPGTAAHQPLEPPLEVFSSSAKKDERLTDMRAWSDVNHALRLIPLICLLKCHQHIIPSHSHLLHNLLCVTARI